MKIYAEHIIGLTAHEMVQPDDLQSATSLRGRYEAILRSGVLRPHGSERGLGQDGSTFQLDHLAGDGQYVFLSYGPRYRRLRPAHLCYGFVFDAADLIDSCSALVGEDLLEDYEDLLDGAIAEVCAIQPPLPPASPEQLAEFAALIGNDPAMLAFVQEQSTSRYHDIDMAVRLGDASVSGMLEAQALFRTRAAELQKQKRTCGPAAHTALRQGMEILVSGSLSLDRTVGRIEAGKVVSL